MFGVRKFHQYWYGRRFTLLTDLRPLTTILGPYTGILSLAASRLQRWALLLSGHSYDIGYRKSDSHGNADGLSRLPFPVMKPETSTVDIFYFTEVEKALVLAVQVKKGRDLRTTFVLLKPSVVKDSVQNQQEKQIMYTEHQAKDRVFMPGESVLARNYRSEPKWVPATVTAQTGPVSDTVQTTDSFWKRHVDQLLQTPPAPTELSLGYPKDALINSPVYPPTQVQNSTTSETKVPAVDVTGKETETSSLASAPEANFTLESTETHVPADCRYPTRKWRPSVHLSY